MNQSIVISTETDETSQCLTEFYFSYVSYLRAAYVWFHSAHHASSGTSFAGDHISLYPKIYGFFASIVDEVIEKGIAQTSIELACPQEQLAAATQIICCYPSPAAVSPTAIAATGLTMVNDMLQFLDNQFKLLEERSNLSLGLDDMIMSHANQIEGFVYMLKQRIAVEMESNV